MNVPKLGLELLLSLQEVVHLSCASSDIVHGSDRIIGEVQ